MWLPFQILQTAIYISFATLGTAATTTTRYYVCLKRRRSQIHKLSFVQSINPNVGHVHFEYLHLLLCPFMPQNTEYTQLFLEDSHHTRHETEFPDRKIHLSPNPRGFGSYHLSSITEESELTRRLLDFNRKAG